MYKDQGIDLLYVHVFVNIRLKSVDTINAVTHVGMIGKTLMQLCHQLIDFCNLQMFVGICKIDKIDHNIASTECLSNSNELCMTSFYFSCFNTIIFIFWDVGWVLAFFFIFKRTFCCSRTLINSIISAPILGLYLICTCL